MGPNAIEDLPCKPHASSAPGGGVCTGALHFGRVHGLNFPHLANEGISGINFTITIGEELNTLKPPALTDRSSVSIVDDDDDVCGPRPMAPFQNRSVSRTAASMNSELIP